MSNKTLSNKDELNTIFSSLNNLKHVLHLYAPTIDKYSIQASFLSQGNGNAAYITNDDPKLVNKKFNSYKIKVSVIHPKDMNKINNFKRIVIDAASIEPSINHSKREKFLTKTIKDQNILCTYDIGKLDPKKIEDLVEHHDKLILTTGSRTVLSSKSLPSNNYNIDDGLINEFVKRELKTIVLALVIREPMCGRDIQMEIYKKFSILLSPGTLYPLLHELEKKGLLECQVSIKTKIYSAANENEIRKILNDHIQAKNFLNDFLQSVVVKKLW